MDAVHIVVDFVYLIESKDANICVHFWKVCQKGPWQLKNVRLFNSILLWSCSVLFPTRKHLITSSKLSYSTFCILLWYIKNSYTPWESTWVSRMLRYPRFWQGWVPHSCGSEMNANPWLVTGVLARFRLTNLGQCRPICSKAKSSILVPLRLNKRNSLKFVKNSVQ